MSVLIVSVTQEVQNLLVGGIPLAMNNKNWIYFLRFGYQWFSFLSVCLLSYYERRIIENRLKYKLQQTFSAHKVDPIRGFLMNKAYVIYS